MINLAVARTDVRLYQRPLDRNTGANVNEKSEECALTIFRFSFKISEKFLLIFLIFTLSNVKCIYLHNLYYL